MTVDTMFGWMPHFVAIGALVLMAATLDMLHTFRREVHHLTRRLAEQEPRTVVVPRPVEIRARRGREEAS